jgi:hypothetical protein
MSDFANRLMPIRSIRVRATAKAAPPGRFVQLFFSAQSGVPNTDFVRCKCRGECCREAVHAIAHQDLRTAEVAISQAFLEFRKCCSLDTAGDEDARNNIRARADVRRADGAREDVPYTVP